MVQTPGVHSPLVLRGRGSRGSPNRVRNSLSSSIPDPYSPREFGLYSVPGDTDPRIEV